MSNNIDNLKIQKTFLYSLFVIILIIFNIKYKNIYSFFMMALLPFIPAFLIFLINLLVYSSRTELSVNYKLFFSIMLILYFVNFIRIYIFKKFIPHIDDLNTYPFINADDEENEFETAIKSIPIVGLFIALSAFGPFGNYENPTKYSIVYNKIKQTVRAYSFNT